MQEASSNRARISRLKAARARESTALRRWCFKDEIGYRTWGSVIIFRPMSPKSDFAEGAVPGEQRVAGRYRLEGELARGGMGVVSSALDESTGSRLAIKRMHAEMAAQQRLRMLFELEYRTLATIEHPRVIRVFDYGVDGGSPYYTMELLDGQDLRDMSPIPYRDACRYLCDVASSLALLHTRRLLHRDLSPRNVRCTGDGHCKLLDFGTMCQFGVPTNTAGTPPFVPPEALRGSALDHRTDIYSLGALAYYLLTRRYAYRARDLQSLPQAWRTQPTRPSVSVEDIPKDLDDLVMSMLSLDPLGRPSSAADVMERLTAIAGLETVDTSEVMESYLLSSPLRGRDRELLSLEQRTKRLVKGQGATLVFEGYAGLGKTRMLDELSMRAQAAGAAVVRVDTRAHRGPAAVLGALARALRIALPYEAERALAPRRTRLEAILRERRAAGTGDSSGATGETGAAGADGGVGAESGGGSEGSTAPFTVTGAIRAIGASPDEPGVKQREGGESRARLQDAMAGWILAVSEKRPLAIMVDDLHRTDELSAAFLAALARETREQALLVVATQRTGEPVVARDAFDSFKNAAACYRLLQLDAQDTQQLVASLFGSVPNCSLVADFLHRKSGGNPGLCTELARQMVNRRLVRYEAGMWVLPDQLDEGLLPESFADAFRMRLEALDEDAKALAAAFSIRRGVMPLELCASFAGLEDNRLFVALDRLVQEGMIVMSGGGYGFANDGMRETVRSAIEPGLGQQLHRRLAEALLQIAGDNAETVLEAGFHLLSGGDAMRGADLMAKVAPRMAREGIAMDMAIPALERALEVYERGGRSPAECLRLRYALVRVSYVFDYRLADRYGDDALGQLLHYTGLDTADRLRPYLGAPLSFLAGLCWAALRRLFTVPRKRGPKVLAALTYYCGTAVSMMGIGSTSLDAVGCRAVMKHVEKLGGAIGLQGIRAIYLSCRAFLANAEGREAEVQRAAEKALAMYERPSLIGLLESDHKVLNVGTMLVNAVNESFRKGSRALQMADAMEAMGTKMGRAAALRIRMMHHLLRGEREQTEKYRALVETHAIQGGTIWQVLWFAIPIEGMAAIRSADLVTLKRVLRDLDLLCEIKPSLKVTREMVVLVYLLRRNDLEETCKLGERFIAEHPPWSTGGWSQAYAALAIAHFHRGNYRRAVEVCRIALSELTDTDREYVWMYGTLELLLAAGEGLLAFDEGDSRGVEEARRTIDRLTPEREAENSPLMMFEVHEIRLRFAQVLGSDEEYRENLERMYWWAKQAGNPAMLAHCERIAEHGMRAGVPSIIPPPIDEEPSSADDSVTAVRKENAYLALGEVFARCEGRDARARQALRLIAQRTQSGIAYLFLRREQGVVLAAASSVQEPPDTLVNEVLRLQDDDVTTAASYVDLTGETSSSTGSDEYASPYRIRVLPVRVGERDVLVGAVAFTRDPARPTDVSLAYLRAIAGQLVENGDARIRAIAG